jgi:hypothetical protein
VLHKGDRHQVVNRQLASCWCAQAHRYTQDGGYLCTVKLIIRAKSPYSTRNMSMMVDLSRGPAHPTCAARKEPPRRRLLRGQPDLQQQPEAAAS